MTKRNLLLISKYFLFTLFFIFCCGFQTSFWPNFIFSSFPPPPIWLLLIIYVGYKWPTTSALFYIYFLGLIITQFSYVPLKVIWVSLIPLMAFIFIFKNRIHSTSPFYFSVLCSSSTLFFSIVFIFISKWLENNSTSIFVLHRIYEIGINFLFSIPLLKIFTFIDQITEVSEKWSSEEIHLQMHQENE